VNYEQSVNYFGNFGVECHLLKSILLGFCDTKLLIKFLCSSFAIITFSIDSMANPFNLSYVRYVFINFYFVKLLSA
jgi:hypothetical protein